MSKNEIVRKNLDLHAEWIRYIFEHPEVLDKIPQGAQLVILPNNDPALAKENNKTIGRLKAEGLPVVIVHLDLPKPPRPQIEVITANS
ncbi:MAG: hypothetical protein SCARUB_01639 [Candidatus Scalindua rubra]|uniref:Uncharacterized protein n=1 Tax=Candidatus Scalindua rubra TaxID=1872076 RepID=A0A1E3XCD2_9BACT|nr:MAG: hypothetical protein SCARUB_01639 [Candidatus Scalindua rubra]